MSYTVSHIIDTDVDGFWQLFFDLDLARAMLQEFGNMGSFEVVEERVDGDGLRHRTVECRSNVELPDFIKNLVGDGTYTEVGCFDSKQKTYRAQCVPKVGASRFKSSFQVTVRPVDDGKRCERQTLVDNSIKMFGLGGMLEQALERAQRDAHEQSAKFINKWLETRRG